MTLKVYDLWENNPVLHDSYEFKNKRELVVWLDERFPECGAKYTDTVNQLSEKMAKIGIRFGW
jgi:hypothetical protein